jgi:hypothetical protein
MYWSSVELPSGTTQVMVMRKQDWWLRSLTWQHDTADTDTGE